MKTEWVVIAFLFIILGIVWAGFICLDKKIDKIAEEQGKINSISYETNKEQSAAIRQLKTDAEIIMDIAISGEYCGDGMNDED